MNDISGLEPAVPVEMRVVVYLPSRPENVDDLPSELIGSNTEDDAFCCAQDWRAARGKDVDALMSSSSASRRTP